jgi:ferritin-like metal-binding protein YciE
MDTKDRMIHYLQDAHAAEVGILEMLEDAIDICDEPAKSLVRGHFELTKSQAQRLENRLEQLGGDRSGAKGMMNTLMAKFGSAMDIAHDEVDRQTMCVIKLYATEHLERGMYESMAAYADSIGDAETARLAREIQREEEEAGQKLFPLIQQHASQAAMPETANADTGSYGYPGP